MRSYLLDEISSVDMNKITGFLKETTFSSKLEKIFWVKIPDDLLSGIQYEHRDCHPYVFAVELGQDSVKLEFFVRSLKGMRCECQGYCTLQQREFILNYAHNMLEQIKIAT